MNLKQQIEVLRLWVSYPFGHIPGDNPHHSENVDNLIDLCVAAGMYMSTQEYRGYVSDYLAKVEEDMNPISIEDHQVKAGIVMGVAKCINMLDERNVDEIIEDMDAEKRAGQAKE